MFARRIPYLRPTLLAVAVTGALVGCVVVLGPGPSPDPTGDFCGGIAGIPCPDGYYCAFEPESCQGADMSGTCQAIPDACVELFDPVCGCDGQTYSNSCFAAMAGVSVAHEGQCP